jgi:hypothetical protein
MSIQIVLSHFNSTYPKISKSFCSEVVESLGAKEIKEVTRVDMYSFLARARWTYRLDDVMNELLSLHDFLFGIGHDEAVQIFFLVAGVGSIGAAFAFFDRTLATDGDFGTGFHFHLLERVTTRSNEEADC